MYWLLYIIGTLFFCYLVASFWKRQSLYIYLILITIFLTPAQIDSLGVSIAPSVPSFLYNVVLEKNYSLRVLRPIVLSLSVLLSILVFSKIRKVFFQQKNF